MPSSFFSTLMEWFEENKRDFPWREARSPYRVWIAEIMLQQTRASVVIPYYLRWMEAFPSVESVAAASIERLIKCWEGLGYYSRVRQIHKTAQIVVKEKGGVFPKTRNDLEQLPGIGAYTAGAILSFAFQEKSAAVDGNVIRLLSRFFSLETLGTDRKFYQTFAENLLNESSSSLLTEAMIEFGALICTPHPKCDGCPIRGECKGYQEGVVEKLPRSVGKKKILQLQRRVALILRSVEKRAVFEMDEDLLVLVRKEREKKVMEGLYEFPYVLEGDVFPFEKQLEKIEDLSDERHSFTQYRAVLKPTVFRTKEALSVDETLEWKKISELETCPFSAGHRKVLYQLLKRIHENFAHRKL